MRSLELEENKKHAIRLASRKRALLSLLVITPALLLGCISTSEEDHIGRYNAAASGNKIKLIYDGDIGPDPCDFSTISMLHEYHKRGMIELLAVIGSTPDPYLASTFSIYNQMYGNDIPIAAYDPDSSDVPFNEEIVRKYYEAVERDCHGHQNRIVFEKYGDKNTLRSKEVMGTVELYRKSLSEAEDDSVVIYTAGQLYNFPPLLASGPDNYSSQSGEKLLRDKVKEFVFMGGCFPESKVIEWYIDNTDGAEWNWWGFGSKNTTRDTLSAIVKMGKPVTYIGSEVGPKVLVGIDVVRRLGREHPTSEAYHLFVPITRVIEGSDNQETQLRRNNPAYDELALFYAVEGGIGKYYERISGHVQIDEHGANIWVSGDGNESYISLLPGVNQRLREVITDRITGDF